MKIVGIGASAGGIEALADLLDNLSDKSNAAYVIVQHLSPDFDSIMDELLAKHTSMPVEVVEENTTVLPNHVYLIPPDHNLVFQENMLQLRPRHEDGKPNLPIDIFLHSLATSLEEKAVAVILSGSGTDGSRGLRTIKEKGGVVLVQEPSSAKFNGMPMAAINLGIADSVLPPEEIAGILNNILLPKPPSSSSQLTEIAKSAEENSIFQKIIQLSEEVSSVSFSNYRESTIARRIEKRMLLHHTTSLEDYYHFLEEEPEECEALFRDFLIGVTRFFRDPETFDFIKSTIIPELFSYVQEPEPVRIWVPGCSTGEEAFSLALLIKEYLDENEIERDFKIFASDIDRRAINFASAGVYPYSVGLDIPSNLLVKYFIKEQDMYRIQPHVRDKVLFAVQNVLSDPPFIRMNLISCRNLLIYLKPEAQRQVLTTFHFSLNPKGLLWLGPSESLGEMKNAFTRINSSFNVFGKKEDARVQFSPSVPRTGRLAAASKAKLSTKKDTSRKPSAPSASFPDKAAKDPFTDYLVEHFGPAALFVTESLDLLYISGNFDQYLKMPRALARMNLFKMMPQDSVLVFQNGIEKAVDSGEPRKIRNVQLQRGGEKDIVDLRFSPVNFPDRDDTVVLIEIVNKGYQVKPAPENEEDLDKIAFLKNQIESLESDLRGERRRSKELVNELEATNIELQVSNQELLASNEELQSTNEELQSVNEELFTVNSELKVKNKELTTTNNDMDNLLKSIDIGTIFLDNELQIRKFTPTIRQQFDLVNSDIGRPIGAFSNAFDLNIEAVCQEVFETLQPYEEEIQDKNGENYLLRILPYRTDENLIKGLVITFIEINDLIKSRVQHARLAKKFQVLFNHAEDVIMILNPEGKVKSVNQFFGNLSPGELKGNYLVSFLNQEQQQVFEEGFENALNKKKVHKNKMTVSVSKNVVIPYHLMFLPIDMKDQDLRQEDNSVLLIARNLSNQTGG